MRGLRQKLVAGLAILLLVFFGIGAVVERFLNRVEPVLLPAVGDAARALHASSLVVDMHADSLLTGRDLLRRSSVGHVDLPRLQEGGVGLQFFTVVTVVPFGLNIQRNERSAVDLITLLGLAQFSPLAFRGPLGRAEAQADRLRTTVQHSQGALTLVLSRIDLDQLVLRRERGEKVIGALLGIEGAHALEGSVENLEPLHDRGFRMIGLAHFFDNEFAGSAHGAEKGGLTDLGRELVSRMESRGMLIDLAHVSPRAIDDVLAIATAPTVVSHGGVKGTCPSERTLSDEHVRAIAAGGGVIGIGYWETAVCGLEPRQVVAAMRYVISLVGDDHVGLGSDFDGSTTVGFDTSQLAALTQEMMNQGLPESSIRKILGGNVVRVLRQVLPAR